MQWHFGDWESLTLLDQESLGGDSQRAMLALLAGSAHQQLGEHDSARELISLASEWGCEKRTIARVLISGVFNTLGRIAAAQEDELRAHAHFEASIDGVEGDPRLACQARSVSEIARLNQVDKAHHLANAQKCRERRLPSPPSSVDNSRIPRRTQQKTTWSREARPSLPHGAIVVAGMRHSGSTALFNIIRLALQQQGLDYVSFYSEGEKSERLADPDCPLLLIKTHEFRDEIASRASTTITTRRDLRDTVASAKRRRFPLLERLKGSIEYAKYNRALHEIWYPHSDYEFVYEAYMATPMDEMKKLFQALEMEELNLAEIHSQVSNLPINDYETSLLSAAHITDPNRIHSFEDTLAESEIFQINRDHSEWLSRYSYESRS